MHSLRALLLCQHHPTSSRARGAFTASSLPRSPAPGDAPSAAASRCRAIEACSWTSMRKASARRATHFDAQIAWPRPCCVRGIRSWFPARCLRAATSLSTPSVSVPEALAASRGAPDGPGSVRLGLAHFSPTSRCEPALPPSSCGSRISPHASRKEPSHSFPAFRANSLRQPEPGFACLSARCAASSCPNEASQPLHACPQASISVFFHSLAVSSPLSSSVGQHAHLACRGCEVTTALHRMLAVRTRQDVALARQLLKRRAPVSQAGLRSRLDVCTIVSVAIWSQIRSISVSASRQARMCAMVNTGSTPRLPCVPFPCAKRWQPRLRPERSGQR